MFGSSGNKCDQLGRAFTKAFRGHWKAYEQADGSVSMHYRVAPDKADTFHGTLAHQGYITHGTSGSLTIDSAEVDAILSTVRGR